MAVTRLADSATRIIPRVLAAVTVLGEFWAVAAAIRALLRMVFRRVISDLTVENLLKQVAYYFSDAGLALPEPDLRRVQLHAAESGTFEPGKRLFDAADTAPRKGDA